MAINFVRKPSETPNVQNIDDFVPFRYAYSNQNGYIKDKGNELSYTINGSNFRINSGRVVLQGVESDIDANGVTITVSNIQTTKYYVVYYHVNLATNTTSIESDSSTTNYPTIADGDDLTANTSGSANLILYKFTALNGIISNVTKIVQQVKYTQDVVVNNAVNSSNADEANHSTNATNAILNNNNTYSGFTRDANGILKIGDIIIPQRKILWSGTLIRNNSTSSTPTLYFSENINIGDTLEISIAYYTIDFDKPTKKIKVVWNPILITLDDYYVQMINIVLQNNTNNYTQVTIYNNRIEIGNVIPSGKETAIYEVAKIIE